MTEQEIIDRINELYREWDDVGESIIDCVVDMREDDGLPPFTPEEYAEAEAECDRNAEIEIAIEDEIQSLMEDYFFLTGKYPKYIRSIIPYVREPYPWEE